MDLTAATRNERKRLLLAALLESLGMITQACLAAGCSRDFYYDCYNNVLDTSFKQEVDAIADIKTDFVEGKLFEAINNGDMAAISLFMKSKWGRKRGYLEDKAQLPAPEESGRKLVMYSLRPRGSGPAAPDNPNNLPATT